MMKTNKLIKNTVLWVARISGGALLSFFFFMIGAHIFGSAETGNPEVPLTLTEILLMTSGVGILIGLIISFFREGLGGFISLAFLTLFFMTSPKLLGNAWFGALFIPSLLYVAYWLLNSKKAKEL